MRSTDVSTVRFVRGAILALAISCSGCAHQTALPRADEFIFYFGQIVENGKRMEMGDRSKTIVWSKGVTEPRIGVYVENLRRNRYDLAYVILRSFGQGTRVVEIETDGWWDIKPPINSQYQAWIYSSKITYLPGDYIFAVYIDGERAKSFDFNIVSPQRDGGDTK